MRNERGLTLAELMISMGLAGGIALTASAISNYVARAEVQIERTVYPIARANVAMETIVQRVMRASPIKVGGKTAFYEIEDEGSGLRFKDSTSSRMQRVAKTGGTVMFYPNTASAEGEELMVGVQSLSFSQDDLKRLIIEMTLENGEGSARTAVAPRTSAQGFIN